jgi:2-polyprenyl-3-methyl-5-hydroxy-6-metoxy-1,4-benzoquinol methylase
MTVQRPQPSIGTTTGYFGSDLEAMSTAQRYHAWIVDEFRPYLGRRCAEVGAGSGNFSTHLLAAGISELHSFEPDQRMFAQLARRFHRDARVHSVPTFFRDGADGRYDSIVYVNVLEHIADDHGELRGIRPLLADNGHLLIFVPALPWLYSRFDQLVGHHRRYRLSTMRQQLTAAGYAVVRAHYFDAPGILPWLLVMKLLGRILQPGSVSLYDRAVVPLTRRIEQRVRPPLGKNILLIARPAE